MTKRRRNNLPAPVTPKQPTQNPTQVVKETHIIHESFSGPLPKPAILQEYEAVLSGAADRILRMAEKQAEHRQLLEKTVIFGDSKRANRGLWAGFIVALCALGGAVFLVYTGHGVYGAILGSVDIVSLASVFVYGTAVRRSERKEKAVQLKPPEASIPSAAS